VNGGLAMINIAVLGYGVIGSGVVEVLNTNGDSIAKRAGDRINVKYVLDINDFPGDPIQEKLVKDINIILDDPEVKIVCEHIGGLNPAYSFVKSALLKGKSVVTSNKELVAKYGAELLDIAKERSLNFLFEASVGGGIPIIRPLNQSLTADEIIEITGILNGTTNYILSKMSEEGLDFDTALANAQRLGYAERNPKNDVEGHDACRKIAILSSLAYGMQVDSEDIYTEGITGISDKDFAYAKALDAKIKLLASSIRQDDQVYAMVAPVMIKANHPLYSVNDVFNGIFVRGNVIGDVMFYGSGAGKLPTASAVVADVVDAAKHMGTNIWTIWSSKKLELTDISQVKHRFFVRVSGDANELKDHVRELFGEVEELNAQLQGEYAFITELISEQEMKDKKNTLGGVLSVIRTRF